MSGFIRVTYRSAPGGEGRTTTLPLPLLTDDDITVEAHIRYSDGEQIILFSQKDELGFYEGRSINTQWPGVLFGTSIGTAFDPSDVTILDLGERGAYVCRHKMAYPFICVDPATTKSPLEIAWLPVDHIEDHMVENHLIFLSDPRSKTILREAGISVEATAMVHEEELVSREMLVEDYLFDLLAELEAETNAIDDFASGSESHFDIGDSGLLTKVHEQTQHLKALRTKMNERIEL